MAAFIVHLFLVIARFNTPIEQVFLASEFNH